MNNFKIKKISYYDKKKNKKILYDNLCEHFGVDNEVKFPLLCELYIKISAWIGAVRLMRRYKRKNKDNKIKNNN